MNPNQIKFDILYKNITGKLNKFTNDIINDEKYKLTILERIGNRYDNKQTKIDIKFLLKNNWNDVEIDTFLNIIKNLKNKNYDIDVTDVKKYIKSLINIPEIISYIKKIKKQDLLEYIL